MALNSLAVILMGRIPGMFWLLSPPW